MRLDRITFAILFAGMLTMVTLPRLQAADTWEPVLLTPSPAGGHSPTRIARGWVPLPASRAEVPIARTSGKLVPLPNRSVAPSTVVVTKRWSGPVTVIERPTPMPVSVAPPDTVSTQVFKPVVPLVPKASGYVIGRGLIGQPKLYVPGQPMRNFLRYLSL